MPVRSALFVDYDNAVSLHRGAGLSNRVGNWINWFEDGNFDPARKKRDFLVKSAYWHPTYNAVAPAFQQAGFLTRSCVYLAGSKKDSSAVDLHLVVDVIDAVTRMKRIEEVVILATDSDYFPLVATLRARDIRTALLVSDRDVSKVYEAEADIAIPAAALADAYTYVRPPRRHWPFFFRTKALAHQNAPTRPTLTPAPKAVIQAPPQPISPPTCSAVAAAVAPELISHDFTGLAERFAAFVSSKQGPVRAPQAIKALRAIAPGMKTSGPDAFLGKSSLLALLSDLAKQSGRIKVFWMGPGQLAVRATGKSAS
jgi:hypothetical protein